MGNTARQRFTASGTFTAPAGVHFVQVVASKAAEPLGASAQQYLDSLGNIFASGVNSAGNLGVGDQVDRSTPTLVLGGMSFVRLDSGNDNASTSTFAINNRGQLFGWGPNSNGQLGQGDVAAKSSPVLVLGGQIWSSVYTAPRSLGSVFGITSESALYAWGINVNGQLGVGDVLPHSSPILVLSGTKFKKVVNSSDSSVSYTLMLSSDGHVYACGSNNHGQLGQGDVTDRSTPTLVSGLTNVVDIGANSDNSFAVDSSGAMYAWGLNSAGALGVGDVTPRSTPTAVLGGVLFSKVYAMNARLAVTVGSTFGVSTAGQLYSWGRNGQGELGLNDLVDRSSPILVSGMSPVASVYARGTNGEGSSNFQVFTLLTSGALYSWGTNLNGENGIGNTTAKSSPVAVLGGLVFYSLSLYVRGNATGNIGVKGVTTDGNVYAWGAGNSGVLGLGNTASQSSPVLVSVPSPVVASARETITKIPVVPGTSYSVTIGVSTAYFGLTILASNGAETVDVYYEQ